MSIRTECVICYGPLDLLFKRDNYPITANPPKSTQLYEEDIVSNQTFYSCKQCSCVQLGNLVDPLLLYADAHNNTQNTPTWKEHHRTFCDFIIKSEQHTILEIGGNGLLFEMMKPMAPSLTYSCLDIYEQAIKHPEIQYYVGNCEAFDYSKNTNIVMSHVFEHLFHPRKFVEKIYASGVNSVFISIPNMERLLQLHNPNLIHNEHTFYVDKINIQWLFSQYKYELTDYYEFKNHSLFLKFSRNEAQAPLELPNRPALANAISRELFVNPFSSIDIKPNSFIIPAGLYGQMLYYYTKAKFLGYIDNDTSKQNYRVYGTPYNVYSFDILAKHQNIAVYLLAGPYNIELRKQIELLGRNDIEIIVLT